MNNAAMAELIALFPEWIVAIREHENAKNDPKKNDVATGQKLYAIERRMRELALTP